jgi:hypothetical protein
VREAAVEIFIWSARRLHDAVERDERVTTVLSCVPLYNPTTPRETPVVRRTGARHVPPAICQSEIKQPNALMGDTSFKDTGRRRRLVAVLPISPGSA